MTAPSLPNFILDVQQSLREAGKVSTSRRPPDNGGFRTRAWPLFKFQVLGKRIWIWLRILRGGSPDLAYLRTGSETQTPKPQDGKVATSMLGGCTQPSVARPEKGEI